MIKIDNLYFSYSNTPPYILDGINFNVKKGDYVTIIGENGSGKSTFTKIILGLLKASKGSISINAKHIAYVPQRLNNLDTNFPLTVFEMLNVHRKTLKIKNKSIIDDMLTLVSMNSYKNSLISNLSGGQAQKIFIIRALMGNPDLLILDEPSTGVDEKSQNEIYPLLKNLNTNSGKTIISVEHNSKIALTYSTHILKVENGTFTLYTTSEFIKQIENDKESIPKII